MDYRIDYLLDKCANESFKLSVVDDRFVFTGDAGTTFPFNGSLPKKIVSVVNGTETTVTKDKFQVKKLRVKPLEQLELPVVGEGGPSYE